MNQAHIHIVNNTTGRTTYSRLHTAPASWAEMTRAHLLLWAATFGTKLKLQRARQVLAALLYQIPVAQYKHIPEREAERLGLSVAFLYGKNLLSNWLIPHIWRGLFKYHGPKSALANVTIYEFTLCERCYEQYQVAGNIDYLHTLAAILYRPCRFWGIDNDIRVPLTNYGYVNRAKRFKKLPTRLLFAIYLNYEGGRNFLHVKYKEVFSGGKGTKINKTTPATPWPKILESAANDIFGPFPDTKLANLHEFLSRLGTRIEENKKMKEDQEKSRR